MPIFKGKEDDSEGWLSILLALRLRQIESEFPDFNSFQKATGLSRGTLYQLRTASGNPTLVTVERLARHLGKPVWSLLGRSDDDESVRADLAAFGFNFDQIGQYIEAKRVANRTVADFVGFEGKSGSAKAAGEKPAPTKRSAPKRGASGVAKKP